MGQIKALDTKVDGLDKRVSNQEFTGFTSWRTKFAFPEGRLVGRPLTNRGILVGLILVILGGAAKIFGIAGNP